MKYYAGIGSRTTPTPILEKMCEYARKLTELGYTLRSGGAIGADFAFEQGAGLREIFRVPDATDEAEAVAKRIHPAWHACSFHAKKLHARNVQIILGRGLDQPVDFVICYSTNPEYGGTRTGIVLAQELHKPVYNLFNERCIVELDKFIDTLK